MIEGRVAQILSDRELIINRGQADGVTFGMRFEVLADDAVEVTDPETGQSLGTLDRPKVRVRASDVHEQFTICETFEFVEVEATWISPSEFFGVGRKAPATLTARESLLRLSPEECMVKIGDRVRQVREKRVVKSRSAAQ